MRKNKKWSKEAVLADALRFNCKSKWKKDSPSSYKKARENKWLEECCQHMKVLWQKKWDLASILMEAKKYRTRKEWIEKSNKSYVAAAKLGIMKEASAHMEWISHRNKWDKKSIEEEMLKYSSISEWAKESPGSYEAAKRLNVEPKYERLWQKKWDRDSVINNAKGYTSIAMWINSEPGAYKAALKLEIVDEAIKHMKVLGGRSTMENNVMEVIKEKFPKAQRISIANKDDKFVAKRFHLDIYIPELKKGIEFDGDYWHSNKGLKRGRPSWTDEQIENYHDLKDGFFKSRNIDVIHIRESDWVKNRQFCIKQIYEFLNIGD